MSKADAFLYLLELKELLYSLSFAKLAFIAFTVFVVFVLLLETAKTGLRYALTRPWVWSAFAVIAYYEFGIDFDTAREFGREFVHNMTSK